MLLMSWDIIGCLICHLPRVTPDPVGSCWYFGGTTVLHKQLLLTDGYNLDQLVWMSPD